MPYSKRLHHEILQNLPTKWQILWVVSCHFMIPNYSYTHFPSLSVCSVLPCPLWASILAILVISNAVRTDCSQLHTSDSQAPPPPRKSWQPFLMLIQISKPWQLTWEQQAGMTCMWLWDSSHSDLMSCLHRLVFTFFSCQQRILYIH